MRKHLLTSGEVLQRVKGLVPQNSALYTGGDIGFGRLFADIFGDICRYNTTARGFQFYDGTRWLRDEENMNAESLAKLLAKALYIYAVDIGDDRFRDLVTSLGSRNKRKTMIQDARDFRFISEAELDQHENLFNVENGTLDLDTLVLRTHDPEDLLSKKANAVYDPAAKCQEFLEFISQIMEGDADKVEYLQRILGYALTGNNMEDEMFMFLGRTTRNGKTTLLNAVGHVLGDYGIVMSPDALAQRQRNADAPSEDVFNLKGTRFVHVEEPSRGMVLDVALVKDLTGHAPLRARRLYESKVTFEPSHKIYMATNYLPSVNDDTLFASDRVRVIEFNRHFTAEEQDKTLKAKFATREASSGILNWLLDGLRAYRVKGTKPPQCVRNATEQYQAESDKVGTFIRECLIEDQSAACSAKEVYASYSSWTRENGYFTEGKKSFNEILRKKQLLSNTGTINGVTVNNVLRGFRIDNGDQSRSNTEAAAVSYWKEQNLGGAGSSAWHYILDGVATWKAYKDFKEWAIVNGQQDTPLAQEYFTKLTCTLSGMKVRKNALGETIYTTNSD